MTKRFVQWQSWSACIGLLLALQLVPVAAMAETYRYKDKHDNWVYTDRVEAVMMQRGYQILDNVGRIKKEIPRAMTREERLQKMAAEAQLAEQERRRLEQEVKDELLLSRYSDEIEIVKAKERAMLALDGKISILRGNINSLKQKIEKEENTAARIERAGRSVPEKNLATIEELHQQVLDYEVLIDIREAEKVQVERKYDAQINRFREIFAIH